MVKNLLFLWLLFHGLNCFAQVDTAAPYWKDKSMPQFSLLNLDSTHYTNDDLAKEKVTIIMLFNPECDHCQDQFKLFAAMPEVSNNVQLLLSSTETMEKIKIFYTKFNIGSYPFVHLAKDDQYVFGKFFQPKTIPVLACYNKSAQFVDIKQGQATKQEIREWLKKGLQ